MEETKHIVSALLIIMISATLAACGNTQKDGATEATEPTVQTAVFGAIEFQYPSDWKYSENDGFVTLLPEETETPAIYISICEDYMRTDDEDMNEYWLYAYAADEVSDLIGKDGMIRGDEIPLLNGGHSYLSVGVNSDVTVESNSLYVDDVLVRVLSYCNLKDDSYTSQSLEIVNSMKKA